MAAKTINIDGMDCGHCASFVTLALEKIEGVSEASVSLEARNAFVVIDDSKVTEEMMISAIKEAGYTVKSIS
ncbi:hypothetical protein MNBD_NITROSPINAE02-905 [hydrothermal vent metagenome]|uniref:HMA domain-containing protein n=1 Tax=hydrothermal vent metagenome TaxID=652676 RepID=A0A3B1CGK5_9ZZZZ